MSQSNFSRTQVTEVGIKSKSHNVTSNNEDEGKLFKIADATRCHVARREAWQKLDHERAIHSHHHINWCCRSPPSGQNFGTAPRNLSRRLDILGYLCI